MRDRVIHTVQRQRSKIVINLVVLTLFARAGSVAVHTEITYLQALLRAGLSFEGDVFDGVEADVVLCVRFSIWQVVALSERGKNVWGHQCGVLVTSMTHREEECLRRWRVLDMN